MVFFQKILKDIRIIRPVMSVSHLEDELSESIRVLVVEEESVAGVGCCRLKQQQEELVSDWTGLEEADQHLQQFTQLQYTIHKHFYTGPFKL